MKKNLLSSLVLLMFFLSGCTLPSAATPTPQPTVTPTITATPTAVPPTATPAPTEAPTATTVLETSTPAATITNVPTLAPCVYSATVVSQDPENSEEVAAKDEFTKTWTLKNTGTCAWDGTSWRLAAANAPGDAELADESSYRMDDLSNPKKNVVIVGDSISLSLKMKAPDRWGTFTQNWMLIDSDTSKIMTIVNGSSAQTIYARVVVPESGGGSTGEGQKPTVEIQSITLEDGTTACTSDARYNIAAKIIGKASAKVGYIISTDGNGAPGDVGSTVTLNDKGGRDVNTVVAGPYSDAGNLQVTITVFVDTQAVNYASAFICQGGAYQQ